MKKSNMCAIAEYHLPDDLEQNLDIIPPGLMNNECIAFHGSSMLYADNVQENGLSRGGTPFPQAQGELIVGILDELNMPEMVDNKPTPNNRIRSYLENRGNSPLSFTFTAYEALYYATEARKGGQIYMAIRDAIDWIDSNHADFERMEELSELRKLLANAQQSVGCIYAVDFCSAGLDEISGTDAFNDIAGKFYCLESRLKTISPKHIIARIVVPEDTNVEKQIMNEAEKLTHRKRMEMPGSLAHKLDPNRNVYSGLIL